MRVRAILALLGALTGCWEGGPLAPAPPSVTVADAVRRTVPVHVEYPAKTEAVQSVDVVARVEGYLLERAFEDGADVEQDQLLFRIQPDEYEAALRRARDRLAKDEAALAFAREQGERYRRLAEKGYVSRELYESYVAQTREAEAAIRDDESAIAEAELALAYTTVRSPIDGRIGRRRVDVGNLVGTDGATVLATVVQLDPIYLEFAVDGDDLPRLLASHRKSALLVEAVLPDGKVHPHAGRVDFLGNRIDPVTGSIPVRAVLPNRDETLLPGQSVRARVLLDWAHDALVVPKKAVLEDEDGARVLVVDAEGRATERAVDAGIAWDEYRVIEGGLEVGQQVVVDGIESVRPGWKVVAAKVASTPAIAELPPQSGRGSPAANGGRAPAPSPASSPTAAP